VEGFGEILETTAPWQKVKQEQISRAHNEWLGMMPEGTVMIYTDGSKLETGDTGSGWVGFENTANGFNKIGEGHDYLGVRAEVYDAELHGIKQALSWITTTRPGPLTVYIGIDNQAAIATLSNNHNNHQYARETLTRAHTATQAGWSFKTIWCKAHVGIQGNELADQLAKEGAAGKHPCADAVTTKAWMQATTKEKLKRRWKDELPLSSASPSFPTPLRNLSWIHTRALFRVFASRTLNDPHPGHDPEPCPCGQGPMTSEHLVTACPSFKEARDKTKTDGPTEITNMTTNPKNMQSTIKFLRLTGIGYRKIATPIPEALTTPPPPSNPATPNDSETESEDDFEWLAPDNTKKKTNEDPRPG
jgi:ribonuclease HI